MGGWLRDESREDDSVRSDPRRQPVHITARGEYAYEGWAREEAREGTRGEGVAEGSNAQWAREAGLDAPQRERDARDSHRGPRLRQWRHDHGIACRLDGLKRGAPGEVEEHSANGLGLLGGGKCEGEHADLFDSLRPRKDRAWWHKSSSGVSEAVAWGEGRWYGPGHEASSRPPDCRAWEWVRGHLCRQAVDVRCDDRAAEHWHRRRRAGGCECALRRDEHATADYKRRENCDDGIAEHTVARFEHTAHTHTDAAECGLEGSRRRGGGRRSLQKG